MTQIPKMDKEKAASAKESANAGVSFIERASWICNTLFHQSFAIAGVVILWTVMYYNELEETFTWHYVLSTVAYVPLMGEAIVLFSSDNLWSQKITRTQKYAIHGCILFVSAVLASAGMTIVVVEKTSNHFVSIHAWTGLVSWVFVLASQIIGVAAWKPQVLPKIIRPVHAKFVHNLFGQLGYVFGVVSLAYGLEKGGFRRYSTPESRIALYWVLGITTCWSLLAAFKSGYGQLKTMLT